MADFTNFLKRFSLDESALYDFLQCVNAKEIPRGEYLLRQGEICRNLFFINEGLIKAFFFKEDKEFILRFFAEDVMFTMFESYVTQTASPYMLITLEPVKVTTISYEQMELLCKKHHSVETFFRKLVSIATVKMTKRISEMLEQNSTERYNKFMMDNGEILQRISLGDLAKYLGITQQSLSRIRAGQ
jgi:CRP-like cAMP-binding protein